MKLILENWRKFLKEEAEATGGMPAHLDPKNKTQADKDALDKMGYQVLKELGRGAFGVVYQVENKQSQERLAAKVVKKNDRETQNYQFAMDNKASMPEQYGKYLPEVYEIAPGHKGYNIILMEELEALPPQVAQDLFAAQDSPTASIKKDKILKNPEAVAEIIKYAVDNNRVLNQMREFLVNREQIIQSVINAVTKISHGGDVQSVIYTVTNEMSKQLDFQSPAVKSSFENALIDDILYYFDKQIVPVHQPEPGEEEFSREVWTGPSLKKVEGLFPEAEGLMAAMKYFTQDKGWRPKDVHINNVMMRPGTNDFVIVDLGLFQRGIFERNYQGESERIKSYNKDRKTLLGTGANKNVGSHGGVKASLPSTRSDGNQLGQMSGQTRRDTKPPPNKPQKGK
mgnify:CR=1 FL=1